MIRTQIYIPETVHVKLMRLARARREPMAHLARRFIIVGLEKMQQQDESGIQALQNVANLRLKGGPTDLSTNLDHYLYGGPKKQG